MHKLVCTRLYTIHSILMAEEMDIITVIHPPASGINKSFDKRKIKDMSSAIAHSYFPK